MTITFILGNPRSGTSLLRLVLNAHPHVAAPPECGFVQWNHTRFRGADFRAPEVRSALAGSIFESRKFETWGLGVEALEEAFERVADPSYESLCEAVYRAYGAARGKAEVEAVVDKNNYYVEDPGAIAAAAPSARFIHLVRDGRDVACSYRQVQRSSFDSPYAPRLMAEPAEIAKEWTANNERLVEFASELGPDRTICVRYEDVVLDFGATAARLCSFLGVAYDESMSRFYERNDEPAATLEWKRKTLGPLDSSTVGRFESDLSDGECAAFLAVAGPTLERFGYLAR